MHTYNIYKRCNELNKYFNFEIIFVTFSLNCITTIDFYNIQTLWGKLLFSHTVNNYICKYV